MTGPRLIDESDAETLRVARQRRLRQQRYEELAKQAGAWAIIALMVEAGVLQGLGIATLIRRRCR